MRFTIGYYRYYRKNQLLSLSLSLSVENGLSVIPEFDVVFFSIFSDLKKIIKQQMLKITCFTIGYYRYYRNNQLLSLSLSEENGLSVIPACCPWIPWLTMWRRTSGSWVTNSGCWYTLILFIVVLFWWFIMAGAPCNFLLCL